MDIFMKNGDMFTKYCDPCNNSPRHIARQTNLINPITGNKTGKSNFARINGISEIGSKRENARPEERTSVAWEKGDY
jgi:hypothetical protein